MHSLQRDAQCVGITPTQRRVSNARLLTLVNLIALALADCSWRKCRS